MALSLWARKFKKLSSNTEATLKRATKFLKQPIDAYRKKYLNGIFVEIQTKASRRT